jgi:hypothetical protein
VSQQQRTAGQIEREEVADPGEITREADRMPGSMEDGVQFGAIHAGR